jgi:zinc transport system substrate-binding protein
MLAEDLVHALSTLVAAATCCALVVACEGPTADRASSASARSDASAPAVRTEILVSNLPLLVFAKVAVGDVTPVVLPIPEDVDPPFWKPTAEDVVRLQSAAVVLVNGATYERWLPSVTLPMSRVVDSSAGFASELLESVEDVTHSHGPAGVHSHQGTAFTTWMDFALAAKQADAVAEAVATRVPAIAANPAAAAAARERGGKLADQLRALAERTRAAGRALAQRPILGSHPVYQYLARGAGLNMKSVHWEPDAAPTPEQWKELDAVRATHPASVMLWESAPLPHVVQELASRGVASIVIEPMGNADDRSVQNWLSAMEANVARLEKLALESRSSS